MRAALIALLLSGCAFTDCKPWIPPAPKTIAPTQTVGVSFEDEFPDIGMGTKCRF